MDSLGATRYFWHSWRQGSIQAPKLKSLERVELPVGRGAGEPRILCSGNSVTKPELGTKRICAGCSAKFYDLHKTPIVCPTCQAVFVLPKPAPERSRRVFDTRAMKPKVEAPIAVEASESEDEADVGIPLLEAEDDEESSEHPVVN